MVSDLLAAAGGRTLIVITHRPSLMRLADVVIVIEGGRVVEPSVRKVVHVDAV
jgi:ABC-type multidrug transport system fused ATPase/permease subunit